MKRKVTVFANRKREVEGKVQWVREAREGQAYFHQFGLSYEEFETGGVGYSTAIIEWPNGKLENVPVEYIEFCEPE